jgi:hypothetical protein
MKKKKKKKKKHENYLVSPMFMRVIPHLIVILSRRDSPAQRPPLISK